MAQRAEIGAMNEMLVDRGADPVDVEAVASGAGASYQRPADRLEWFECAGGGHSP